MANLTVHIIPVMETNYVYAIEGDDKRAVVVDPGVAKPVANFLKEKGLVLEAILLTHHHDDHIGGASTLQEMCDVPIYGAANDKDRLPPLNKALRDQDQFQLFGYEVDVIATPGHTKHHICYYVADEQLLFAGDTLFSIGCGRVFEGTMEEMHASLQFLKDLPEETRVYCGHEYTLDNLKFALSLTPNDPALIKKMEEVEQIRSQGKPTMPFLMRDEKALNPFLKAKTSEEFADIRRRKDIA